MIIAMFCFEDGSDYSHKTTSNSLMEESRRESEFHPFGTLSFNGASLNIVSNESLSYLEVIL